MKSTINKCSLTPIPKRKKAPTCDPHCYDALYKIKLKFVRHSFISYYSNFPSFNSSQVKDFKKIKYSSDLLFFNANKKIKPRIQFTSKICFFFTQNTFVFYVYWWKITHARRTSQYFDSSDFVGYLKSRLAMTPYGMFLDL